MEQNIVPTGIRTYFLDSDEALDISSANKTIRESSVMMLPTGMTPGEISYLCQHIHRVRSSIGESAAKRLRAERRTLVSIGQNALNNFISVEQLPLGVPDLVTANNTTQRLQRSDRLSWRISGYLLDRKLQRIITDVPESPEQQ